MFLQNSIHALRVLIVCYYHVTYAFQSESTLYSCLNVNELLARNKCDFWSLSDSNRVWTHNHFVRKQTLNHLAKPAKIETFACVLPSAIHHFCSESAKLRILRAHVPMCLACLRAHVPTCLLCLRAHVLTCQLALRAHTPTCLPCLRAHVPTCFACSRANVPCVFTCWRALRA